MIENYLLKWDSDFFNFKIAALHANVLTDNQIQIFQELSKHNYKLVYLISANELSGIKALTNVRSCDLVDIKLTYQIKLDFFEKNNIFDKHIEICDIKEVKNQKIRELAFQSGKHSRFYTDKNFNPNRYYDLYQIWIEKSINRDIADEVFIYKEKNEILGFITISKYDSFGKIGLIAVDTNSRGKGIGKKLIDSAAQYLIQNNIYFMNVATQEANTSGCTFYEKCGFILNKSEYYYHIWL
jgi:dTDP-4-amino-4,6-dideoxy-D-galactose acyltransferase